MQPVHWRMPEKLKISTSRKRLQWDNRLQTGHSQKIILIFYNSVLEAHYSCLIPTTICTGLKHILYVLSWPLSWGECGLCVFYYHPFTTWNTLELWHSFAINSQVFFARLWLGWAGSHLDTTATDGLYWTHLACLPLALSLLLDFNCIQAVQQPVERGFLRRVQRCGPAGAVPFNLN